MLVAVVKLFLDHGELSGFKGRDRDPAPRLGASDQRGVHPLQHRALAEGVHDRLHPTPLLEKEAFEKIGRPDHSTVLHRKAQMRDASFEVVQEAAHCRGRRLLVALDQVIAQDASDLLRGALVSGLSMGSKLRPVGLRDLGGEIAHPMG